MECVAYDLRRDIPELIRSAAAALASARGPTVADGTVVPTPCKHPPSPPKFTGDKGEGKVTINAWLLHFLEWCTLYSVPAHNRVAHAILALEGPAVESWYSHKQQLVLDGRNPYDWDVFRADMVSKYADVSPDPFVRSNMAALRQGNTSVQAYYDKFRGIISQADHHPVLGAEAVWHFKQGLSDRIRIAIAIYGDDDLDTVVMQAKRVDAAFRLETSTHPAASGNANRSVPSAGAKRFAASTC